MAATVTEHGLLIDGERVETGEWTEVRSPFSGEVVGRIAQGRRRRDAARARRRGGGAPLPAARTRARPHPRRHGAAPRGAAGGGRAADLRRGGQAAEDGARRGPARGVDLHLRGRRGTQARRRDRADGRLAGRRRQARAHAAPADRDRRRDLALQLPAQPRRAQDRAGARRRLPGRAEAGVLDAALGALPRRHSRRRPACRPAGSTSSRARPPRSAT